MRWKDIGLLLVPVFLTGCASYGGDGYYGGYDGSGGNRGYEDSYTPAPGDGHDSYYEHRRESSRVIDGPDGTTYVFHESNGDTDIVHPDGSVTTVTHDPDGTRTVVGPNGVQVEPGYRHDYDDDDDD